MRPSATLLTTGRWSGAAYFEGGPALHPALQPDVLKVEVLQGDDETTGTWEILRNGVTSIGELTLKDDGVHIEGTLINRQCVGFASARVTGGSVGRGRVSLNSAGFSSRHPECRTGAFSTHLLKQR